MAPCPTCGGNRGADLPAPCRASGPCRGRGSPARGPRRRSTCRQSRMAPVTRTSGLVMVFPWLVLGHSMRGSARHWAGGLPWTNALPRSLPRSGAMSWQRSRPRCSAAPQAQLAVGRVRRDQEAACRRREPIGIVRVSGIGDQRRCGAGLVRGHQTDRSRGPQRARNDRWIRETRCWSTNEGYFADGGGGMRPARCHHISRPSSDTHDPLARGPDRGGGAALRSRPASRDGAASWRMERTTRPRTHRGSISRSGSDFYLRGAEGFNFAARVTRSARAA